MDAIMPMPFKYGRIPNEGSENDYYLISTVSVANDHDLNLD